MCYNFTVIEPKCDKVNVCYYLVVTKNVDDTLMRYNLPHKSNEVYVKSFFLIVILSINEESVVVNIFFNSAIHKSCGGVRYLWVDLEEEI